MNHQLGLATMSQGFHADDRPHPDDRQLNQRAWEAQQYPARSYERRNALTQLTEGILRSGRIKRRPYAGPFPYPQSIYEDLYNEALNATFLELCQNIDRYDPQKGDVMAWCNYLLKYRFLDALKRHQQGGMKTKKTPIIGELDEFISEHKTVSESQKLRHLIEDENPSKMFTDEHIKGQPKANFQFLALARVWDDRKWQDISVELKIPPSSLCEFYQKRLKEFTPHFRE